MNRSIFNSIMGTIDACPYAPRSKQIVDPGTAMLAGAGVSLLGNVLGFGSSQSANSTNLEIARMNNEEQYKMFKEQNAFNLDMWNKNNAYNDPSKNVERLLRAGINPAAVYGNASTTPASQIQSATAPQLQRAEVRPFMPDLDGVGQAVNAYFDNQMKSKAAESTGIDNQMKMIDLKYKALHHIGDLMEQKNRIDERISNTNLNNEQKNYLRKQSDYLGLEIQKFRDTYEVGLEREKLQNDVMKAQQGNLLADSTLKRAQATYIQLLSAYYPDLTQAQLNVMSAQFTDLVRSAELKVKEGQLTSAKAVSQYLENGIKAYDYSRTKTKQEIRDSSKIVRGMSGAIDMIGETLFGNLKLFGK